MCVTVSNDENEKEREKSEVMGDDQRIGTVANFVISALGPAFAVRSFMCVRRKVRE